MPVPLHNIGIGEVIQPRPVRTYEEPSQQQTNQVENEQAEQRTEASQRTEANAYNTERTSVNFVRESIELNQLLSGEKGILIDTRI